MIKISENDKKLIEKIKKLKKEKNALILAHNYQRPEIYEVADFIGDSFGLAKKATESDKKIIVFCGVDFMGESASILNPDKTVLLPELDAKCPMAAMITIEALKEMKKKYPRAAVVSYVNSSAAVKAESDICCTSANAIEVVNSLKEKQVIFVPDKHLANYAARNTEKEIIVCDGFCYVHDNIDKKKVLKAKENNPDALFIAHPECPIETLEAADHIASTAGMIAFAKENNDKKIIVGTEVGMINMLNRESPENQYFSTGKEICHNMKKNTLEKVYNALKENKYVIHVPKEIRDNAKKALERMMEIE